MIKILVVDDESSIQAAFVYALSREGYEMETAGDGQERWKRLIRSQLKLWCSMS